MASTMKTLVLGPGPTQEHQLLTRMSHSFLAWPGSWAHSSPLPGGAFLCLREAWSHSSWKSQRLACSVVTLPGKAPKPGPAGTVSGSPRHSCLGVLGQLAPTMGQTRSPHTWERALPQVASLRGPRGQLPQRLRCFARDVCFPAVGRLWG